METQQSPSTSPSPSPSPSRSQRHNSGRKLQRQRSRLQMHAPASITIGRVEPASISNWQVPIPLLSPLDISPVYDSGMSEKDCESALSETNAAATGTAVSAVASGAMWRHPAEPFYYEPLPGCTPGFAFSNCAWHSVFHNFLFVLQTSFFFCMMILICTLIIIVIDEFCNNFLC